MKSGDVRNFLRENLRKDVETYFGFKDPAWLDRVTHNWFDDQNNYDGRWWVIKERRPKIGRVLDMACGCGTFVLFGLRNRYDVWGLEPEKWKRQYFTMKVKASNYPAEFLSHIIGGVGEVLPFKNENFDLVTTYQTLEHVQDENMCIQEMLRVLKPGGILYIRAPDYNSFYEPHYRVPFLPQMNKKLASVYLRLLGRPTLGLQTINWVTEKKVVEFLRLSEYNLNIERTSLMHSVRRQEKIRDLLPLFSKNTYIIQFLNFAYELKSKLIRLKWVGRAENNIDLWVTKKSDSFC